jgi:hypothetical protein
MSEKRNQQNILHREGKKGVLRDFNGNAVSGFLRTITFVF